MSHKYTTDGKKVIVIGNLNSQEIIVQEIFVTEDGAEIPSGEHFLVKTLHEKPVESWKAKDIRKMEARYDLRKSELKHKTDQMELRHRRRNNELGALIKHSRFLFDHVDEEVVGTFLSFLNGEITHVVKPGWSYQILPFADATDVPDSWDSKLKLITLFGETEGELEWRLGRYSDGSGSNELIIPCTSMDDAKSVLEQHMVAKIANRGVGQKMIDAKEKYGLSVPTEADMQTFYGKQVKGITDTIKIDTEKLKALEIEREKILKRIT
jgi:hypothetical protein